MIKHFTIEAKVDGIIYGKGVGSSKKMQNK